MTLETAPKEKAGVEPGLMYNCSVTMEETL